MYQPQKYGLKYWAVEKGGQETKFLNKNNMSDFGLFIEQDITDKK